MVTSAPAAEKSDGSVSERSRSFAPRTAVSTSSGGRTFDVLASALRVMPAGRKTRRSMSRDRDLPVSFSSINPTVTKLVFE